MDKWKTKCGDKVINHGEAGARIGKVGTPKWKSYCARSGGIAKKFPAAREPCSPNMLSRKKWKCGSVGLAVLVLMLLAATMVSASSWGGTTSITETTGVTIGSTADEKQAGMKIMTKEYNLIIDNITTSVTDMTNGVIGTTPGASNTCTSTSCSAGVCYFSGCFLSASTSYYVGINKSGATFNTKVYNTATPIVGTYLNFTTSWAGTTEYDNQVRGIEKIGVSGAYSSILFNSPVNNYISPTNSITFNATAIVVAGATLKNMSLYTNVSGTFRLNQTYNYGGSITTNTSTFTKSFPDGDFLWGIKACDSDGACGFSANRTVTIDTAAPTGSILYPTTTLARLTNGQNITLNFSITDTDLDSCWKEYNGANATIPCTTNNSFIYVTGVNTIKIWANDSAGNKGYISRTFTPTLTINGITYTNPTYSTRTETFTLNVTYNTTGVSSVIAKMVYNNTNYSSSITGSGNAIITNTLAVPAITSLINKSFYWVVNLNGTEYSTETYNQTISPIEFGICGGSLTAQVINFTTRSASNPFPVVNATFKTAWEVSATNGGVRTTYNFEDITERNSTWSFCTSSNLTIYADAHIEYDGGSFALNSYYLVNATLQNTSRQAINLYLLNDSLATTTVLKVRDNSKAGIEGVTIQIQFYDVGTGTFYTVGMAKTDFKGEDVVYLNWYDSLYKFTIIQDGELIKITNTSRITETPTYFDIEDTTTNEFDKFEDFIYSFYFNNATNNFVVTYTKPSGEVDSGCLRVIKRTALNDTTICDVCETSASATLSCNVGSYGNGTYLGAFYATGSYKELDLIAQTIGGDLALSIYNALGKKDANFYAFMFSGIVIAVSFISPVFGVIGALLGVLGGAALGFSILNWGAFVGLCIVGIFVVWSIKR